MNINGKWKGYYQYGVGYLLPYFGSQVEMEVSFIASSDGNIEGSITEIPSELSVDAEASLKGFIDQSLVSFIKTYNVFPEITDNGSMVLTKGTLDIQHTGYIDFYNEAIYGDWLIEDKFINEEGCEDVEYLTGIWFIERA